MIESLVAASIRNRRSVVAATLVLAVLAIIGALNLQFDALPDVTGNQVVVLTTAFGYTPDEVERRITRPLESALGGIPGVIGQRSLSRYGISSITVIFDDAVEPYLARQLVQERLTATAPDLPTDTGVPALGPLTGGLGEILHFTLTSPQRSPADLYELAEWEVAPLLRTVPGVVEVNTWGGQRRTLDVVLDPSKMAQHRLTLRHVTESLRAELQTAAGASLRSGARHTLLRGVLRPDSVHDLSNRVVRSPRSSAEADALGAAVTLGGLGTVRQGALPRLGSATVNGRGETVYVMIQMLRNANALDVTARLQERLPAVRAVLPPDVRLDVVYDRSVVVHATLDTVFENLSFGGLLVVVVLLAMLGSLRAGLLVALVIPLSMLGAAVGMVVLGIAGNLMSLGALDFGLLVDGAVVMVENIFHHLRIDGGDEDEVGLKSAVAMARPVFFSVLVILLVYVPVVSLTGVDGKMFRPMALTVILALVTSLVLALTFIPAAATGLLRREHVPERPPWLVRAASSIHGPLLAAAMARPGSVLLISILTLMMGVGLFIRGGTSFVPQLDEGDLVVQTTRAPDISIEGAVADATRMEAALLEGVPEVRRVVSRIGSPAVATDIMGLEQADVFVAVAPPSEWRAGLTKRDLVAEVERVLRARDPDGDPVITQPIQMRFNELVAGETTDVAVSIYGPDLDVLSELATRTQAVLSEQPGAVDVRVSAPPAVELLEVRPDPVAAAQHGLQPAELMDVVRGVRNGVIVGETYDGRVTVPIRVRLGEAPSPRGLPMLMVPTPSGRAVPLAQVATVRRTRTPSLVSRESAQRRITIGFNVRGLDLGTAVKGAQEAVSARVRLPPSYRITWGGQYETLKAATARMQVIIPVVLVMIVAVLLASTRRWDLSLLVFANVPFAGVGGITALAVRGMPVSISAAVGFIALSGIAVLNGVVLVSRLIAFEDDGLSPRPAAERAASVRMRPVLMTALVAALGFLPMMLATGVGAEVQRPLATVVVGGLVTSTVLTLLVLPSLYAWLKGDRTNGGLSSPP